MDKLPEIILFDLDGTLIDNSDAVVDAYYTGLERYNYPPKDRDYIASLAGLSSIETAKQLDVKEKDCGKIDAHFWEYFHKYADHPDSMPIVFEKVRETLIFLRDKNIKMAIVTSNEASIAKKLLKKVNLLDFFDAIIGAEMVKNKKPHIEPIELAFNKMGVDFDKYNDNNIEKYWLVGDTASDVGAAKNAGIRSISIPQPHTYKSAINEEPDILIDSMVEFYRHILSNFN